MHEAAHPPESAPPLPEARTWFPDEVPTPRSKARRGADAADDSDSDIEVGNEIRSMRCPLTLLVFKDPLKSKKCPHVFEASAIRELIRSGPGRIEGYPGPAAQCPATGCTKILGLADLEPDIAMARRVRRAEQSQRRVSDSDEEEAVPGTQAGPMSVTDEDDDDVDDYDEERERIIRIKREKLQAQRSDDMDTGE